MKRIVYYVDVFLPDADTLFKSTELTWSQLRETLDNWEWLSNKFAITYRVGLEKSIEEVSEDA